MEKIEYEIKYPFVDNTGKELKMLTFRALKVADLDAMNSGEVSNYENSKKAILLCSGLSQKELSKMDARDFTPISELIAKNFF